VNNEDGVIRVEHVDNLQKSSSSPLTLDEQLLLANLLREWRFCLPDNLFGILPSRRHAWQCGLGSKQSTETASTFPLPGL
jgi:hypothetical protein